MSVPYLACMLAAAAFYHLPPRVLPSIQAVEGGRVGLVHANTNGTADLGVMQINTIWIAPVAEVAGMSHDATRARLAGDPCFNIAAAGAILRAYLRETHGDIMMAIGLYHSHTPPLRDEYLVRVTRSAGMLFGYRDRSSSQRR